MIEAFLRDAPADLLDPPGSRLTTLAVDIGDKGLEEIGSLAAQLPTDRSQIETLSLDAPMVDELKSSIARYIDFLKLEYPLYHPNPDSAAWLPDETPMHDPDGSISRAVSKAVYGRAYYDGDRRMLKALKRFYKCRGNGRRLDCVHRLRTWRRYGQRHRHGSCTPSFVGTLGRRVLVAGLGIAPHPGHSPEARGGRLHTAFSELDVLCDETKNKGVTLSCGELFKNPFTAGFILVPQPPNMNADQARALVDHRLATLFLERRGANLWEALRLLNWVAAPSTQHSAARTPWGSRWIHMLGFGSDNSPPPNRDLRAEMGLLPTYRPDSSS